MNTDSAEYVCSLHNISCTSFALLGSAVTMNKKPHKNSIFHFECDNILMTLALVAFVLIYFCQMTFCQMAYDLMTCELMVCGLMSCNLQILGLIAFGQMAYRLVTISL